MKKLLFLCAALCISSGDVHAQMKWQQVKGNGAGGSGQVWQPVGSAGGGLPVCTQGEGLIMGATEWECAGGSFSPPASCMLDGVTVEHLDSYIFYSATTHTNCASVTQSRTCNNGTLDGSNTYQYANCGNVAGCTMGGVTIAHGASRYFYSATSRLDCTSVRANRTCNNGVLNGSNTYQYANCTNATWPWTKFTDSLNNRGTSWRESNTIILSGLPSEGMSLNVSPAGNTGVRINGTHYDSSQLPRTVYKGNQIQARAVSGVQGGKCNTVEVTIGPYADDFSACTKDYAPRNCSGRSASSHCSGSVVYPETIFSKTDFDINGCVDALHESPATYNNATCIEADSSGKKCTFYNGVRVSGAKAGAEGVWQCNYN